MKAIVAEFISSQQKLCHSATDKNNVFLFSAHENKALQKAFSKIDYDAGGSESYITEVRRTAYNYFPDNVIEALERQKAGLSPRPYLVFANLPFDQTTGSPGPQESSRDFKKSWLSENLNIAFSSLIGEPYSVAFEGKEIINNLIPYKDTAQQYTGLGSDVELSLHTENALLKFFAPGNISPDGLLLQGVRHDHAAPKTHIADGVKTLALLDSDDIALLRESRFLIKPPTRWRDSLKITCELCPLISGPKDNPNLSVAFYSDMVTPQGKEATATYARFYEAAKAASVWVDIKPGMMVYTDNRLALHSRDGFKANYDANGRAMRWLQRTFLKDSLFNFREFEREKDRVFNPSAKCNRPQKSPNGSPEVFPNHGPQG